jgi:hypothetical protein
MQKKKPDFSGLTAFLRLAFCILLSAFFLLSASAQTTITATFAVTNSSGISAGNSLVVDGQTFLVTNSTASLRYIATNNTAAGAATNIYTKFTQALANRYMVSYGSSTSVVLRTYVGQTISASISTNWGTLTFATNTAGNASVGASNLHARSITLDGVTIASWGEVGGGTSGALTNSDSRDVYVKSITTTNDIVAGGDITTTGEVTGGSLTVNQGGTFGAANTVTAGAFNAIGSGFGGSGAGLTDIPLAGLSTTARESLTNAWNAADNVVSNGLSARLIATNNNLVPRNNGGSTNQYLKTPTIDAATFTGSNTFDSITATTVAGDGSGLTNLNFWNRRELVATNLPTDGTSSASQGLQDSINAVSALGGGTVVVPYIANGLAAKNVQIFSNIRLRNHSTIKHGGSNPSGYTARTIGGAVEGDSIFWGTNAANIALEGGTLLGTRPEGVWNGYDGNGEDVLQFYQITNLLVRDLTITNAYQDGLELKECDGVMVESCYFRDISDAAIEARGSTNTFVRNSYFERVFNAVMVKPMGIGGVSSEGLLVENCRIRSFSTALLLCVIRNCRIENNLIETTLLPIATGITNGALSVAIDVTEHPVFTAGLNVSSDVSIARNRIIGRTNNPAIRFLGSTSSATLYNNRVTGNHIQNCKGAVIFYSGGLVSDNVASELLTSDVNNPAYLAAVNYNTTNTAVLQNNITQGDITAQITLGSRGHAIGNVIGQIVILTGSSNAVVKQNIAARIVASTANNSQISGNRLEATHANGVLESVGNYNTIEGNSIWRGGSGSSVAALFVNGDGNTVSGNTITNNHNQTVVQVTGGFRNVIMGNSIYNSTSSTSLRNQATDTVLSGNTIWGGNQLIRSVGTNAIIISNIGTNGLFQGLDLTSTSATNLVIGNRLHGLSSNYQDAGTRNQFYMNWNHSVGLYGISTNATPPADTSTIKSWFNVTLPDGNVFKAALYQ